MNKVVISIIAGTIALLGLIVWFSTQAEKPASVVARANMGAPAPELSLPATNGRTISLSEFTDKKNVLLYFHEGLSCDPCIQQVPELEKALSDFEKMNVEVLSIALDPVEQQKQAAERLGVNKVPMLSYDKATTEVDYDLTRFSMGMGRRAGHTFVLVGTDGNIKWRKDYWPKVGHMVEGGKMFVDSPEIVLSVKVALGQ